jgi:hypothetical protein
MKPVAFALVGLVLLGVAHAAPLAEEEAQFISQEIGSVTAQANCPNYEVVPNAAEAIGDRMGVGRSRKRWHRYDGRYRDAASTHARTA